MTLTMRAPALLLAMLTTLLLAGCGINNIPTYENGAKAAWSEVLNQYKRRNDLIGNLVETVKGFAEQEKTVLTQVTEARARATSVQIPADILTNPEAMKKFQEAQNTLGGALRQLMVVAERYPDKPVVITEAGWATNANGRGIDPGNSSQDLQAIYYADLMDWTRAEGILAFVFEAFDEPWKGSPDPKDPEKHWGLFTVDREPKKVMQQLYPELISGRQAAQAVCAAE